MQVVTRYMPDEVYLGDTPHWMFLKEEPRRVFNKFVEKLQEIEQEIQLRNGELDIPYSVLLPSKIPAGVSI